MTYVCCIYARTYSWWQYQAAGRPLLDLAKQFATISKDVEDKEWALRKVGGMYGLLTCHVGFRIDGGD